MSFKGTFRSVFERFFAEMNEFRTVFCRNARVLNRFWAVLSAEICGVRVKMGKMYGVERGVDGFEAGSVWIRIGFGLIHHEFSLIRTNLHECVLSRFLNIGVQRSFTNMG